MCDFHYTPDPIEDEMPRERCVEILGRNYRNLTDEQMRAAVRNQETRRRAMEEAA